MGLKAEGMAALFLRLLNIRLSSGSRPHHWRRPGSFETQWLLPCAGDTQALAPATAEQAADASAPQPGLEGAAEEEEDERMAEDAQEEPLPSAGEEALDQNQVPMSSLLIVPNHEIAGSPSTCMHCLLSQSSVTTPCRSQCACSCCNHQ